MKRARYVSKKLHIALDLLGEYGWEKFFGVILPWFLNRRYFFYSFSLVGSPLEYKVKIPLRLELATKKDFHLMLKLRPCFYNPAQLQDRFRKGHLCFIGWMSDEPVHMRWVFTRSHYLPYLHRVLSLAPGEFFTDEAYTVPGFRQKGVYANAVHLTRCALKDMGYERHISLFASWDTFLIRTAEELQSKKIGEGGYWDCLGYRQFFWKGKVREGGKGRISILPDDS